MPTPPAPEPVAGQDYYIDEATGLLTFTAEYLRKRGYCCGNGCRHCPYGSETPCSSTSAP